MDVQHTDIIINNCDIAATEEGASDRAIQYDDGDLDFTTLTITNTHISAPLWDPMTLMGNNQGIGVKTRAKNTTFSMTNCTVNGFRHCAEWKGNFTPGNVYLTNCIFQNFNNGRGNHIQEFTDGEVIITDCSYIGSPGNKPDGGDEALRIQNSTNMEVTIDGLQTGNSEEAVTCDQDHRTTFLINDAHILAMSGEAEQGFKILESTDASWRITNSSIHGFQSGIECFNGNTGSGGTPSEPRHIRNSSITFSNSLFENNQRAIRVQGTAASSGPNTLTVTGTVILRSSFTGQFTAVSFEDTASPGGSALFRNCTFHDNNQNGVTNTAGSAYPITIDYCIFSEWGVNALSQASTGVAMSENFNVFVDLSSSAQFGGAQAAAIVHGGGSLAASALEDVYCDQDPLSLTYLFIRADGMAAAIDGAKNAGAKDTCFVTTDVENWSLYR
ncbi:MAG: hypothetical protein HUU16_14445 [Candidatus Omnitrophica bacterium]|nr:hypothetical protein [Candidatus Omnitrophota bacterium]